MRRKKMLAVAVSVTFGIAAIAAVLLTRPLKNSADTQDIVTAVNAYSTPNAQRAVVTLLDGTRVTLSAASHLEVPSDFGLRNRTVYLNGEAYFQVINSTSIPFIVKTFNTNTRVLGTEFGVRAYTPSDVRVAVKSGRVSFNTITLDAGDIARKSAYGSIEVAHNQSLNSALAFAEGQLVIETSLRDALPDLNRWYDADIRFGDSTVANRMISGIFAGNALADLSAILELTFHIRVVQEGRTITLFER